MFPFSLPAFRGLYGWAGALRARFGPLALLPALPFCVPLALLQTASQLLSVFVLCLFTVFGSMFAMAAHGDTKITCAPAHPRPRACAPAPRVHCVRAAHRTAECP